MPEERRLIMKSAALQEQVEQQILADYPSLYRLAFTYVKNPDDAMDVVQESVYKAILGAPKLRSQQAIKSWLCRIVVNTALDLMRRRPQQVDMDQLSDVGTQDTYQDPDVFRALERLEEKERTVVVLRFFQDLKLREIAQVMGEKPNTVKTILYRSLKKLKIQLSEGVYQDE